MDGSSLAENHVAKLKASAVDPDLVRERGYETVTVKAELRRRGFATSQLLVPSLVIPLYGADGEQWGFQARPDHPRQRDGHTVKYETPAKQRMNLDVHPRVAAQLSDPKVPAVITEGPIKGDAAVSRGMCCVALLGVWSWRGKNEHGGKTALAAWHDIALNDREMLISYDSDVMVKAEVHRALDELGGFLRHKGASVRYVYLPFGPNGEKQGLDDWLAADPKRGYRDLYALSHRELRPPPPREPAKSAPPPPSRAFTLLEVEAVFTKHFEDPDLDAVRIALGARAANLLPGDPVWALVIAPPSSMKTELVLAVKNVPHTEVIGRPTQAAWLSGTSVRERAADASGGVLRRIGDRGCLVIKDFGAILTMPREARAVILQDLRDIFDGYYTRPVGSDGGRNLEWKGQCGLIAATTDAIDQHYGVIGTLGDRYLSVRLVLPGGDEQAERAMKHRDEVAMRAELADAVAGLFSGLVVTDHVLPNETITTIAHAARFVATARSAVTRDRYRREIVDVLQPEQPARLAKELGKLYRGLRLIGVTDPMPLVLRVALDSMPRGRLAVLQHLHTCTEPRDTAKVAKAVKVPTTTAGRHLEDLEVLGLVTCTNRGKSGPNKWQLEEKWARDRLTAIIDARDRGTPPPDIAGEQSTPVSPAMSGEGARQTRATVAEDDAWVVFPKQIGNCLTCGEPCRSTFRGNPLHANCAETPRSRERPGRLIPDRGAH